MLAATLLLLAQDVEALLGQLDRNPAVAEQILAAGEAARKPLKRAGQKRLLDQLDLALRHERFENFAHRLWFGTEPEALALLGEVGGITERGGRFGSSGVKGFLRPPAVTTPDSMVARGMTPHSRVTSANLSKSSMNRRKVSLREIDATRAL